MQDQRDIWQFTEEAPDYASATADLWHWSTNYDAGAGPFTMFVDLIGWSEDEIGQTLYKYADLDRSLGYVELEKLAKALSEYANRPTEVREWVNELMAYDGA